MYPIPAVLVNCGDSRPFDVRAELAVPLAAEFALTGEVAKK